MLKTNIVPIPLGHGGIRHAYLIVTAGEGVLIDPGTFENAATLLQHIEAHLSIKRVHTVILQCTHCSNTAALNYLMEHGLEATMIHASEETLDLNSVFNSERIKDLNYALELKNGETLTFIPAPFLPYPDAFMTFFTGRNALFSSNVFSHSLNAFDEVEPLLKSLQSFHELHMPSSEFLRPVLKQLQAYPLRSIYPAKGVPIKGDFVRTALTHLINRDFYNTNLVTVNSKTQTKHYNYPMILNHMLKRLTTHFKQAEIMAVFKDTPIVLEQNIALEIKDSALTGYKLWNRFFDEIYQKKGISWLSLLEPVVHKYTKLYGIKKPSIYQSKLVQGKKKVNALSEEKSELKERLNALNDTLSKTTEQLLRCPITNLYNAQFFRTHLQNNLNTALGENKVRGFLAIKIDAFKALNNKQGKKVGDETLQNAAYLIDRLKPEETLLFRSEGPGFYLYFDETSESAMQQEAIKIRNGVKDSSLFIETITVSIAVVRIDGSVSSNLPERVQKLVSIANKRLEHANSKGPGQIIDATQDLTRKTDGTILLVDEDETIQNLMVQIFSRIQYDVHIAEDIYSAYEYIQQAKVDVIVSEINLSKLDGLQFKRWLNDSQSFKMIPFIIASHHKTRDVIKRANGLGVDLVLKKPIIPEELIGHVKRMRERRRAL